MAKMSLVMTGGAPGSAAGAVPNSNLSKYSMYEHFIVKKKYEFLPRVN